MSGTAERLVHLLADGELHSGARLAHALGLTRAAVWKTVAELRERGIEVVAQERHGYRLERPIELLAVDALHAAARACGRELPASTDVVFELGSTNETLYAAPAPVAGAPRLLFAEQQTAGRGRRGRAWLAPFGSGLTFSIGWTFAELPPDLSALGLALGVCVVRALRAAGAGSVELKWPNDIVHRHAKLGGLLLQVRSETGGPVYVVAGLGLNLALPASTRAAVAAQPDATCVTDLASAVAPGASLARTAVAARVAATMLAGLGEFARTGFASFAQDWARFDSLRDAPVRVLRHDGQFEGVARGADAEGALRVDCGAGRIERVHAGEVSLRRAGTS